MEHVHNLTTLLVGVVIFAFVSNGSDDETPTPGSTPATEAPAAPATEAPAEGG